MCGIVGASALVSQQQNILPVLIEGLRRLEYRGYDSCGVAFLDQQQQLARERSTGRVQELSRQCATISSQLGIGHTRWATHGGPSTDNAHPHFSGERFALVHNGIIENYQSLRQQLLQLGFVFQSQTDTEVIVHWIAHEMQTMGLAANLLQAVQRTTRQLKGAYAIAVIDRMQPDTLVAARAGSPLVVGFGAGHYLASDIMAIAGQVAEFAYLEDHDVVELTPTHVHIFARQEDTFVAVERARTRDIAITQGADLGPYRHYMQKEIFEQPRALADTLQDIADISPALFGPKAASCFEKIRGVHILACGTSFYAGLVAQYWIEQLAHISVKVEIASEFRYRQPVLHADTLVVCISQSGETADTLSALRFAKSLVAGIPTLAICNVQSAALVRETDCHFITRAGVEVGVASTKAFTTQLLALYLLAQTLAQVNRQSTQMALANSPATHSGLGADQTEILPRLRHLPVAVQQVLALEPAISGWAEHFAKHDHALFLGRGGHYPIALEGALKLKEISYIHAEGYPAGELKHGPLALVTAEMPVIVVAPNDALLEKLHSNMQEVRARGGQLFVFADKDSQFTHEEGMRVITLPEYYGHLSPLLHVVALQLLAYHTALYRGTDVDKPRNLAKSVTVE